MTISNDRSSSLSPRGAWLFALAFWIVGLSIIGVALGWIPIAAQDIHAPRWIVGAAGVTFIAGGFAPLAARWGPSSILSQSVGAGVVLPFGIGAILLDILIVMFVARRVQGNNTTSK